MRYSPNPFSQERPFLGVPPPAAHLPPTLGVIVTNQCPPINCYETRKILSDSRIRAELLRQVYTETQNWARHNEMLVVGVNTVLLGGWSAIFASAAQASTSIDIKVFWATIVLSIFAFVVTLKLNSQYKNAINRVVVYERYFLLHDQDCIVMHQLNKDNDRASWGDAFVPKYLHYPPGIFDRSASVFFVAHIGLLLVGVCGVLR